MSYPPPPAYPTGPPQAPGRVRGRTPIRVGIVLLVVAVIAIVVGGVVAAKKSLGKVNDFQRVSVADGTGSVKFSDAGGYIAYYESSTVNDNTTSIPLVGVVLTGPSGAPLVVDTTYGGRSDHEIKSLKYQYGGHHGAALYQFHISTPGTYSVTLTPNSLDAPDATIAFGKSIAGGTVVAALLIVVGVLLLIAGLIVLIVGLVKRSRHKKELASGGYGGYGGYPAPPYPGQPYPAQGYPAQGYPAQGYPAQPYPAAQGYPATYPAAQGYPTPPYPGQPQAVQPDPGQPFAPPPAQGEPWPQAYQPEPAPAEPQRWAPPSDPTAPPPNPPSDSQP